MAPPAAGAVRSAFVKLDLRSAVLAVSIAVAVVATGAQAAKKPPPAAPAPAGVSATFTVSPPAPRTGDIVTFRSTSHATGPGNRLTKYEWDLDGNGSYETTGLAWILTRSYPTRRSIEVKLRVTDSSRPPNTDIATRTLTIADRPPVAAFGWTPALPAPGDPVTFTSTATDPDGTVADVAWDLNGDGNFDNGTGPTAMRSFPAPGSYVVGLRVTDSEEEATFLTQTVTVRGGKPATPAAPVIQQRSRPRLMSPFPIVRVAGRILRAGARVRLLVVRAPRGAKVSIRCRGRGCPFAKSVRAAARVRVRRLERLLPAGVTVQVFVTKRGLIGKYTRLRIRAGLAPARADRCLPPGRWRPIRCPGS
jgi:PKD domain